MELYPLTAVLIDDELCWLAGGAVRARFQTETIEDYDLFFRTKEDLEKTRSILSTECNLVFECPEGKLFTYIHRDSQEKIQCIVNQFYSTPEAVIDSFDIIAGCAVEVKGGDIICHPQFLISLEQKSILFHRITYPASTLKRIVKYAKKGYYLSGEAIQYYLGAFAGMLGMDLNLEDEMMRIYID